MNELKKNCASRWSLAKFVFLLLIFNLIINFLKIKFNQTCCKSCSYYFKVCYKLFPLWYCNLPVNDL